MSKKKSTGSNTGILALAVAGILAAGGYVMYRKQQEGAMPEYSAAPDMAPAPTTSTGTTVGGGITFGVDYSRYLGLPSDAGTRPFGTDYTRYYRLPTLADLGISETWNGGVTVTPSGPTPSPTLSSDASTSSGTGFGVRYYSGN